MLLGLRTQVHSPASTVLKSGETSSRQLDAGAGRPVTSSLSVSDVALNWTCSSGSASNPGSVTYTLTHFLV